MTGLTALARSLAAGLERAWTVAARLVKIRDGEEQPHDRYDVDGWPPR